jgi:hypothetical protein
VAQTDSSIVLREEVRSSPGMRDVQELAAALVLLRLDCGAVEEEEPMVPVRGVREEVEAEGWDVLLRGSSKVLRSAGFFRSVALLRLVRTHDEGSIPSSGSIRSSSSMSTAGTFW